MRGMSFIIPFCFLSTIAAFISDILPMRIVCAGRGRCNREHYSYPEKGDNTKCSPSFVIRTRNRGEKRDGDKDQGVQFISMLFCLPVVFMTSIHHAPITIGDMRLFSFTFLTQEYSTLQPMIVSSRSMNDLGS